MMHVDVNEAFAPAVETVPALLTETTLGSAPAAFLAWQQ
jgi:hypothetical protein